MGRQILILNEDEMQKAIKSPLFGTWTRRAYIANSSSGRDPTCTEKFAQIDQFASTCLQFLKRLPNLWHLSLRLDFPSINDSLLHRSIFSQVAKLSRLRRLELLRTVNGVPDTLTMCIARVVAALPLLREMRLECWEAPALAGRYDNSYYQEDAKLLVLAREREFAKIRAPSLAVLELTVGPTLPLDFTSWIFASANTGGSMLQVVDLKISMYLPRLIDTHLRPSLSDIVTAIDSVTAFSSVRMLSLSLGCASDVNVDGTLRILHFCASSPLVTLKICDKSLDNASLDTVLQNIPTTIEELHYSLHVRAHEISLLEEKFLRFIRSDSLKIMYPSLRQIMLSLTRVVHGSRIFTTILADNRALGRFMPTLSYACNAAGITLRISTERLYAFS